MIKNITRLEHKIGDRIYHLLCDQDSPTLEIKEVCTQFIARMIQIEQAAMQSAEVVNDPNAVIVEDIN